MRSHVIVMRHTRQTAIEQRSVASVAARRVFRHGAFFGAARQKSKNLRIRRICVSESAGQKILRIRRTCVSEYIEYFRPGRSIFMIQGSQSMLPNVVRCSVRLPARSVGHKIDLVRTFSIIGGGPHSLESEVPISVPVMLLAYVAPADAGGSARTAGGSARKVASYGHLRPLTATSAGGLRPRAGGASSPATSLPAAGGKMKLDACGVLLLLIVGPADASIAPYIWPVYADYETSGSYEALQLLSYRMIA